MKRSHRILAAIVMVSVLTGVFWCGWVVGRRSGDAYGLAGGIAVPTAMLPYVRRGETNRVIDRFEVWVDMNALHAARFRKKLWMLPEARRNLDKVLLSVSEYREQYPRALEEPLHCLIYPSQPYRCTNQMDQALKDNSDDFWRTVAELSQQKGQEDSNHTSVFVNPWTGRRNRQGER